MLKIHSLQFKYYLIEGKIDQAVGSITHKVDHFVSSETSQRLRGGRRRSGDRSGGLRLERL